MILMFIRNILDWFQDTTKKGFFKLKNAIITFIVVIFVFIVLLWLSIFLYGSFYYSYMPTESYILPVHLNFRLVVKQFIQLPRQNYIYCHSYI